MTRALMLLGALLLLPLAADAAQKKYWVAFKDKGPLVPAAGELQAGTPSYGAAAALVSERALHRRAKVLGGRALLDARDLPLYQPYLDQIPGIIRESRWLNAVSVVLTEAESAATALLPGVRSVMPVGTIGRTRTVLSAPPPPAKTAVLDYGPSLAQIDMVRVRPFHDLGINGAGVLIGMLDTGFRWRVHESLSTRAVVAEYDFIFDDDTTANQGPDVPNQDQHGTLTMSALGGYRPGQLIGPAYNATFVLAKTEDLRSETPVEEDNWAAAIEWMEGMGVDLVSSSLGYNDFDPQGASIGDYTWANGDFDGQTSVTARAAARAARLGVVVCTAMGNEGNGDGVVGTMLTPADADSVLGIGAVSFGRHLASFSSTGPTNDGRFKPDLVAPGVSIYCASTASPSSYFYNQGTSLATPLTAGVAALLLSVRPELTPVEVRDILRTTADSVDADAYPVTPNNFTGWGLVDASRALFSVGPVFGNRPVMRVADSLSVVDITVASAAGILPGSIILRYAVGGSTTYAPLPMALDSAMVFPTSGRYTVTIPALPFDTLVRFYVTASDSAGRDYQSPAAVTGNVWELRYGTTGVGPAPGFPKGYVLHQNFPNPFPSPTNPATSIRFELPRREHVTVRVYDMLGRQVATLLDATVEPGQHTVGFDAGNLASGVYLYEIATPSFRAARRLLILR